MVLPRRRTNAAHRYLERRGRLAVAEGGVRANPIYGLPEQEALSPATADEVAGMPDLLHPEASARIDQRAARRALEFAFTAGDSAGIASGALSSAAIAPSRWQPASFADELFLDELIDGVLCFELEGRRARIDRGYLRRLLTEPPREQSTVRFRQAVLRELDERPALEEALRHAYARIAHILQLLDESESESRYGMPRWRLDLLRALRDFFDSLHGPFADARSGLARLHAYAQRVQRSDGYHELRALLDFESSLAHVDLRVRLGADGKLRELTPLAVHEHRATRFYRGPLRRWLLRLFNLFRGYQLTETGLVERWFDRVFGGLVEFLPPMLQLRGDLEFYLAGCQLRRVAASRGLATCLPELMAPERSCEVELKQLDQLFNPLLLLQRQPPVACDLSLDTFRRSCVVTGPNSGGKTRLLQALALTQLMGQCGLPVPAARATLRVASGMFVSLGHPSSADAQEGRLGTELLRIRRLFEAARPGCMIVLDELCSGTNPSEGEEIFHLVVDLLRELRPEVYITTHFLQFAASLAERADELALCFLQVELDADHAPTYQFVTGVATTSLAHRTAARLGVSREELLALIRRNQNQ